MRSLAGSSIVLLPLRGGGDIKGMCRRGSPTAMGDLGFERVGVSGLTVVDGEPNVDAIVKVKRMRSDWFKTEAWRDDEHTNIKVCS